MTNTPWTTKEGLQHARIRLEAAVLHKVLFIGIKVLDRMKRRLNRLAQREQMLNAFKKGQPWIQVVQQKMRDAVIKLPS